VSRARHGWPAERAERASGLGSPRSVTGRAVLENPFLFKNKYNKKKTRIYKIGVAKKQKLENDDDTTENNIYLLAKKKSIYIIITKSIDFSDI
jgi:hypothetical protein